MPEKSEKTLNMKGVAKKTGLNPIVCGCGSKLDGAKALENFFKEIIDICSKGGEVRLKNFGIFSGRLLAGRKVNTSGLQSGEATFDDQMILRFRQSVVCKRMMNKKGDEDGNV